jgi:hypothetical protein
LRYLFAHILDPRTGYPATACRSVTIWATSALIADEIDDAVFILGPKKGLELIESLDGVAAVIVDATNNTQPSKTPDSSSVIAASETGEYAHSCCGGGSHSEPRGHAPSIASKASGISRSDVSQTAWSGPTPSTNNL